MLGQMYKMWKSQNIEARLISEVWGVFCSSWNNQIAFALYKIESNRKMCFRVKREGEQKFALHNEFCTLQYSKSQNIEARLISEVWGVFCSSWNNQIAFALYKIESKRKMCFRVKGDQKFALHNEFCFRWQSALYSTVQRQIRICKTTYLTLLSKLYNSTPYLLRLNPGNL
jgi:hypothetical protein